MNGSLEGGFAFDTVGSDRALPNAPVGPPLLGQLATLLTLASPALPIGSFSYSQGLESAVHAGMVHDARSLEAWMHALLGSTMATYDLPVYRRLHRAVVTSDAEAFRFWNDDVIATRDSAELRAETIQMGHAMRRLAQQLSATTESHRFAGIELRLPIPDGNLSYPAGLALLSASRGIEEDTAALGYVYAWCEFQVTAALKCIRMGQTDGQPILWRLHDVLPGIVARSVGVPDEALSSQASMLSILSCHHELQYSRLFRS